MTYWTDYKVPTINIATQPDVDMPVRGLALEDIGALIAQYLEPMMELTAIYVQSLKDVTAKTNMTDFFIMAARSFPELTSEVIATVTDTPELRSKRMPAGLQVMILRAAFELTVKDAGGMGNLSAMLSDAVKAALARKGEASQKLQDILSPSSIGGAEKTRTS